MSGPPPTLLALDPPLQIEGLAEISVKAAEAAKRVALKGANTSIEDIINSILPPRIWEKDNATWMQYTSKVPTSRNDVLTLEHALNQRLKQREARESGICPVREDLYGQAFDELLRQVTLDFPERGLLLLRVKDEMAMTIDAYKTLYESSVAFGVRKQLQAEEGIPELKVELKKLLERKAELENQVITLRTKIDVVERRQGEKRLLDEKRRSEEIAFLKHQSKHLEAFLKNPHKS